MLNNHTHSILRSQRRLLSMAAAAAALIAPAVAHADVPQQQPVTWVGGTSGNWSVGTNWSGGIVPTNSATMTFAVSLPAYAFGGCVVTLDMSATVDSLYSDDADDRLDIADNTSLTIAGGPNAGQIDLAGVLKLNSAAHNTQLLIGGSSLTLGGTGSIDLGQSADSFWYSKLTTAGPTATLNNQMTIVGAGQVGVDRIVLHNSGTIDANVNSATLRVDPDGSIASTNTGVLRASNGGVLELYYGQLDNTGGTIQARSNSIVLLNNFTVSNGLLTTAGDGVIRAGDSAAIRDVTNAGQIDIPNTRSLAIHGTIVNDGSITLGENFGYAEIRPAGASVTLAGSGNLYLSNNINNRIFGAATTVFNNQNTISGAGQLGLNQLILNNTGTILSNYAGSTLRIDVTDASTGTNAGLIRATNGGIVEFLGSKINNTGGRIEAANGSTVEFTSSTIIGGTLANSGTGMLRAPGATLSGVTLDGHLNIANGETITIAGTISNLGSIALNSTGDPTSLRTSGNATLSAGGLVTLSNNASNYIMSSPTTSLNNYGAIEGAGQIGLDQMVLRNAGTITANRSAGIVFDPSANTQSTNSGVMRADGGKFTIANGLLNNTDGVIEAANASTFDLNAATISGGTVRTVGTGVVRALGGTRLVNLDNQGQLTIPDGQIVTLAGMFVNDGTLSLNGNNNQTDLRIAGEVALGGTGPVVLTSKLTNRIIGNTGIDDRLVNQTTIRGSGQLGANSLAMDNFGTIIANSSTARLYIDLGNSLASFNLGTLQASGGILQIQTSELHNNSGVIRADDLSAVYLKEATIMGGKFMTVGSGTIAATGNSKIQDVANNGALIVPDAQALYLAGTITNNATFTLNAAAANSDLRIDGDVSLVGSGSLVLSDNPGNRIMAGMTSGGTLTSNVLIQGAGQLGADSISVINHGTIVGGTAGAQFVIDPIGTGIIINTGVIRAANATGIQLGGGVVDSTAGAIQVTPGSQLLNYSQLYAGSIALDGTMYQYAGGAGTTGPIAGEGTLILRNSGALSIGHARLPYVSVEDYATLSVSTNGSAGATSHIGTLALASEARLDLNDNNMVVTSTPLTSVRSAIASARHGGAWDRPGITSSAARNMPQHATTLGLLTGEQYILVSGLSTFDELPVNPTDALLKYTWYGDADFNGVVNFDDYSRIDNGFSTGGGDWFHGDFDYNGVVNFDDYALIDLAFNVQSGTLGSALWVLNGGDSPPGSPSVHRVMDHLAQFGDGYAQSFLAAVPEPASSVAAGVLVLGSLMRRRRHLDR